MHNYYAQFMNVPPFKNIVKWHTLLIPVSTGTEIFSSFSDNFSAPARWHFHCCTFLKKGGHYEQSNEKN